VIRIEQVAARRTSELRRAVLRPAWPVGSVMPGDSEPGVLHLAAFDEEDVLSACVLFPKTYPIRPELPDAWQLRGMATAEHARGGGVGARLLDAAASLVADRGGRLLWCHARVPAMRFYERCGFVVDSAEFVPAETGIPHRTMCRELAPPPTSSPLTEESRGPARG
jgi:GNAT superfamily N-acetyltransferase